MSQPPTISDKINEILTSAPKFCDPEDADWDGTLAQLHEPHTYEEDEEECLPSSLPKPHVSLDEDVRYAGKATSRKSLRDSFSEGSESGVEESESGSDEEESVEESGSDVDDMEELSESEEKDGFKALSGNLSDGVSKSVSVKNQINLWESLLEMRIQMQKCVMASNRMPQQSGLQLNPEINTEISDCEESCKTLLDKLLLLQDLCLKKYPETRNLNESKHDTDDEEIPSEDELSENEEINVNEDSKEAKTNKRKLSDYEKEINDKYQPYKKYCFSVIQKWDEKTRPILTKNMSNTSVVNQIEHILSDKQKLIKRTQLKRSNYKILLKPEEENSKESDPEIYDDDDFYHQLLRELIEYKSADVTDPVQLSRQWVQLQNLRNKMKKTIDTRATKGRKIRYTVHSKLVNFMAPIEENSWTDLAKNELFGSLFGKKQINNKKTEIITSQL